MPRLNRSVPFQSPLNGLLVEASDSVGGIGGHEKQVDLQNAFPLEYGR